MDNRRKREKRDEYFRKRYEQFKAIKKKQLRERRHRRAEWFLEYKSKLKCSMCKENHPACLDFHHIDPTEKEATVSQLVAWGRSQEEILIEISKCIILCSNCHRKHHWNEKNQI